MGLLIHKCVPIYLLVFIQFGYGLPSNDLWGPHPVVYSAQLRHSGRRTYDIGVIADMDQASHLNKNASIFTSYLQRGKLFVNYDAAMPHKSTVSGMFDSNHKQTLTSGLNENGRGMELSALRVFNNRLLTCDDRTGVVFDIPNTRSKSPVPWVILNIDDGSRPKGFKCEWETIKNGYLYVGSHGDLGYATENGSSDWVKRISPDGVVTSVNWSDNLEKIREALGVTDSGYVVHESGAWDDVHKRWIFLPRQVNPRQFDESQKGCFGSNLMVIADENFTKIQVRTIGPDTPNNLLRGYASFKFIPNTNNNLVVAIKSQECEMVKGNLPKPEEAYVATWVMVFSLDGTIIMPEQFIEAVKYEGIEFL